MLVLRREVGQRVVITGGVVVKVVEVDRHGRIALGFEGPEGVRFMREEIAPPDMPRPAERPKGAR